MEIIMPQSSEAQDTCDDLVGAYYKEASGKEYDAYILLQAKDIDKILNDEDNDRRAMHILSAYEPKIAAKLHARYPAPAGAVFFYRMHNYRYVDEKKRVKLPKWQRGSAIRSYSDCFVLLKRPLFPDLQNCDAIVEASKQHGPILITKEQYRHVFRNSKSAEALQCVITPLDDYFYRVNYSPGTFRRREYRVAKRMYEARTAGCFPDAVLHSLYASLSPSKWPCTHPFNAVVIGKDTHIKYGWGLTKNATFDINAVLKVWQLTKKLYGKPWWREDSAQKGSYSWQQSIQQWPQIVVNALQHVHGVETAAWAQINKAIETQQTGYKDRVSAYRQYLEEKRFALEVIRLEGEGGPAYDEEEAEDFMLGKKARLVGNYDFDAQLNNPTSPKTSYYSDLSRLAWFWGRAAKSRDAVVCSDKRLLLRLARIRRKFIQAKPYPTDAWVNLKLCKLLRDECRALKLKMPKPAVEPIWRKAGKHATRQAVS